MESWGNGRANAYYEAKMPSGYAKPSENDPVRVVEKFIRDKYEHKKFVGDSIPEASASGIPQQDQDASRRESRAAPAAKPITERAREAPAPTPPVPTTIQDKAEPNLLDFFDEPAPAVPAPAAVQSQQAFADPFGGGGANGFGQPVQPSQPVHVPSSDPFFGNSLPTHTSPAYQQPPAAQKPMASNDAILSLFSSSSGAPQQHGHGMQGGGGGGFGISTMPPPQSHMSGMMPPAAPMMGHHMMHQPSSGMMSYGGGLQPRPPMQGYGMQQQQQFQHPQGFGSMPLGGGSMPLGGGFGMQGQGMQQQMGRGGPMQGGYPGFNQGFR